METFDFDISEKNGNANIHISFDAETFDESSQKVEKWMAVALTSPMAWRFVGA
jgi:hypothetical protein